MIALAELGSRLMPSATRLLPSQLHEHLQDQLTELLTAPELLRAASFVLREVQPILVIGQRAFATRFADVLEVLENPSYFHVTEIYARAMERTTGAFILGMDDEATYEREAKFLRSAVQPGDIERVRGIAQAKATQLLVAASNEGSIDAASGYAHKIALAVVADYFGVKGPDEATMTRWMRTIFWDLFLNLTQRERVTEAALQAAAELNPYLEQQARELRTMLDRGIQLPDHFFARLVRKQAEHGRNDDAVRRGIGGVIVGAVDTVAKTIVHSLDQLLRRPEELQRARDAALAGDDALLAAYVFEALRFNPHNPVILRHCAKDFRLARGTEREMLVRAGTTVYASTISAMFDASVVEDPHAFRIDRPPASYLHFGRGMHRCFGEHFNRVVVPQAIKALLLRPQLGRARGSRGHITYQGPFPTSFSLRI